MPVIRKPQQNPQELVSARGHEGGRPHPGRPSPQYSPGVSLVFTFSGGTEIEKHEAPVLPDCSDYKQGSEQWMSHKAAVGRPAQVKEIWKYKEKGRGQLCKRLIFISGGFFKIQDFHVAVFVQVYLRNFLR